MAGKDEQGRTIGLRFSERMSGYVAAGESSFEEGESAGKKQNSFLSFEVTVHVEDVENFCKLSGRKARLEGTVSFKPLGEDLPIRNGEFTLFRPDRETGKRRMTYSFGFTGNDRQAYFLHGYKVIHDDPHRIDGIEDMTRLFTRIYRGESPAGMVWASGVLYFHAADLPSMLASFEVTGAGSALKKMQTVSQFLSFCYGEIRNTYLSRFDPIYRAEYENLILNGKLLRQSGEESDFFFFSGIHSPDFPWGDGGVFWDIALIIRKADGGWAKYVLTDRMIEGLKLNVEEGTFRYEGPVYQLLTGYQVSRSELQGTDPPGHLLRMQAQIHIRFDYEKYPAVGLPFSLTPGGGKLFSGENPDNLREWLPRLKVLGLQMTPHKVRVTEGKILLQHESCREEYGILTDRTLGEAEKATLQNIRWPKLYYRYLCALNPDLNDIYIQIRSGVLRKNRKDKWMDTWQQEIGRMISHLARLDLEIIGGSRVLLGREEAEIFQKVEDPLLEINSDHFATAVFQRRIIPLRDGQGKNFLGLEEEMDLLRLEGINCARAVKVAAIKNEDKFRALDDVLAATDFFGKLDCACRQAGKGKEALAVVVKPNFMFMYSRKDPSTYTDPQLVEHLMDRMFERGYRNLTCAEARSTYGVFFTNREVKTVARHIGLREKNYRVVDLSEDLEDYVFSGTLGKHYVNREWKNADFRIAFAKNKTHSYAFYTLTIKDIYGALPLENKFFEYHHCRDIYSPAIEFIRHFPVHYALIDAHISADGPFGIFADKNPNVTETIIGSEDLVATDWIGAAKMGLDPMVSDYMKKAVEAFGKPRIELTGDRSLYPDWVNVTDAVPLLAFGVLDRHYFFGNLFYAVFAYMEDFFQYKDPGTAKRLARILADPVKSLFFQKVKEGEMDGKLNRKLFERFKGGE